MYPVIFFFLSLYRLFCDDMGGYVPICFECVTIYIIRFGWSTCPYLIAQMGGGALCGFSCINLHDLNFFNRRSVVTSVLGGFND